MFLKILPILGPIAFFKMFLEIHIQNKGHIWKNKGCFWVTWTKISLKNYSMMPIVGLFLAILGFSNVNLRFLAHFHELQRKTSLRMTHKNIKSSLRTISFLEPLKSSYFFGQFKPWRSYKLCSYKKKECRLSLCNMFRWYRSQTYLDSHLYRVSYLVMLPRRKWRQETGARPGC